MMDNKLVIDMPMQEYLDMDALSGSDLEGIASNIARWKYLKEHPEPSTQAQVFGSAFHCLILEPDEYPKRYIVQPQFGRKKAELEAKAEWRESHAHLEWISQDEYELLQRMAESVHSHEGAMRHLEGEPEVTALWTDKDTGLACKARPDSLNRKGTHAANLKTAAAWMGTPGAEPEACAKTAARFKWHLHAAFHSDGIEQVTGVRVREYVFVVVEKEPPFSIGIYDLDEPSIELGRCQYTDALRKYKYRSVNEDWEPYGRGLQTLSLPPWA